MNLREQIMAKQDVVNFVKIVTDSRSSIVTEINILRVVTTFRKPVLPTSCNQLSENL